MSTSTSAPPRLHDSTLGEGSGLAIRQAGLSDIPAIRAIEMIPAYREFIGSWTEDEYRQAIADSGQEVAALVDRNGKIAGFYILRGLGGKDRSVELMRIAVREPGSGAGRGLLEHALARAFQQHGAHRLWLDVFTTNLRAQHVYQRTGFVVEGTLRDAKLRDGRFQSQIIMSMLEVEYCARERRRSTCQIHDA